MKAVWFGTALLIGCRRQMQIAPPEFQRPIECSSSAPVGSLLAVFTVSLLQGGVGIIASVVALPSLVLVIGRCLIAASLLGAFAVLTGRPLWRVPRRGVLVICGVLLGLHWLTLFIAYRSTTVAITVISVFTFPLFTSLMEPWFFGSRPGLRQVLCAGMVLAGVGVLLRPDAAPDGAAVGIAWGMLSALLFAVRIIINRRLMRDGDAICMMTWQTLIAAVLLLPGLPFVAFAGAGVSDLLGLLLLGVVFTAVPHTVSTAVLAHLSAATVGIVGSLQVFSATMLALALKNCPHEPKSCKGSASISRLRAG